MTDPAPMDRYARYRGIEVTLRDGIASLALNRPDHLNAVDADLHEELEAIWPDLAADDAVKAVVLSGKGRAFSAGGDVAGMAARAGSEAGMLQSLGLPRRGRRLIQNMLDLPQPLIAAVNGDAVGLGATLALFCDVVVMAETARIGDPHVRVGIVAGDGGAVIWPLLVGPNRAKEMLMRGTLLSAAEAERLGLVNHLVPAEAVQDKAMEIAVELTRLAPWAVRYTKASVNQMLKQQLDTVLNLSLAFEALTFQTRDHKEAAQSFLEKRRPAFRGM